MLGDKDKTNLPSAKASTDNLLGAKADPLEFKDSLLASFTRVQKQYIVKHLYPELNKALVHFISEATRYN